MRAATKKLTTAAVCTALALVMCVCTAYLPLSIMPLYVAAFCIFLACKRGSLLYGALSAIATVGIMFIMTGLSVKWLFLVLMFAPYGIVTYFIHRFNYFKPKSGIIRGITMAAFFNLTLFFVYLVVTRVVTVGLDIPMTAWVNRLGGYWAIALIGTVAFLPLDFIFSAMSSVVLKRIPMPVEGRKKNSDEKLSDIKKSNVYGGGSDADKRDGESTEPDAEQKADGKKYDIFGYEILDDKDKKE